MINIWLLSPWLEKIILQPLAEPAAWDIEPHWVKQAHREKTITAIWSIPQIEKTLDVFAFTYI